MNGALVQMASDLVFSSGELTVGAAVAAGGLVAAAALWLPRREGNPRRQALVAGVTYAAAGLVAWTVPEALAGSFVGADLADLPGIVWILVLVGFALGVQAGLPVYLRVSRGLVTPALVLWPSTAVLALGVAIDSMLLFFVAFAPSLYLALVTLAVLEVVARRTYLRVA